MAQVCATPAEIATAVRPVPRLIGMVGGEVVYVDDE